MQKILPMIEARLANDNDCEEILAWRNDIVTRNNSPNSDFISREDHTNWFSKIQRSKNSVIIILSFSDDKIGMVRYDCINKSSIISININPVKRGMGYSTKILIESEIFLRNNSNFPYPLIANILKENEFSIRSFRKAGYQLESENDTYYRYLKNG